MDEVSDLGRASSSLWEAGAPGASPQCCAHPRFPVQPEPSGRPSLRLSPQQIAEDRAPQAPTPLCSAALGGLTTAKTFTHFSTICIPKAVFPTQMIFTK